MRDSRSRDEDRDRLFSIQRGEVRIVIDRDALLTFYDFPLSFPGNIGRRWAFRSLTIRVCLHPSR